MATNTKSFLQKLKKAGDGILNDSQIKGLIRNGFIKNARESNVSPASLDIAISSEIYRLSSVFLPTKDQAVPEVLDSKIIKSYPYNLNYPLEINVPYLVRLREKFRLPSFVRAMASPKSSSGRIDLHVRVLSDYTSRYDQLQAGYRGGLWLLIVSKSFPVIIGRGTSLIQLRFLKGNSRINTSIELKKFLNSYDVVYHRRKEKSIRYESFKINDLDASLILTLDLTGEVGAWMSKSHTPILDLRRKAKAYSAGAFFTPLKSQNRTLFLGKDNFYIFSIRERIKIPINYSSEFIPVDAHSGEFRSHYAGFVDPGWGSGGKGHGRQLSLEIRPFEDIIVTDRQAIVKMRFDKMAAPARLNYDRRASSHYLNQRGPRLAKYFYI
jgi:dCTP deaminase